MARTAGITVGVRLVVDAAGAAGWTDTTGIGAQGAVLIRPEGDLLLLDENGMIREDYQLTVKPLAD